jgi:N-acetylmuramic acid 6-phosphate etherase
VTDSYSRLATEAVNPRTRDLDLLPTEDIVATIFAEDAAVARACAAAAADVARIADAVAAALRSGGRCVYAGAGTSGRLAQLDASEWPPTFGTDPSQTLVLLAGGRDAMFAAQEGAEDDADAGARAVRENSVGPRDFVLGVSASGATPFVLGALREARRLGAPTGAIMCATPAPDFPADHIVCLDTGPEVLAGSTRMKAGSATKMTLNAISLAAMVRLHKVHGNRMVDLRTGSRKLVDRARRLVMELSGVDGDAADRALAAAGGQAKLAILVVRTGLSAADARRRLDAAGGSLRAALEAGKA